MAKGVSKKGKKKKSRVRPLREKFSNGPNWFVRSSFYPKSKWGFIPKNWRGTLALVSLVGINVFAANYLKFTENTLDYVLKFGVVFFLSIFIFVEIAKHKTQGTHPKF